VPLSHIDPHGEINMVDVAEKAITRRSARARGKISMSAEAFAAIMQGQVAKGNVLATAKIAGIMAAKNTAAAIPLCHPLAITKVAIDFFPDETTCSIEAEATVAVDGKTGVEMEAIHGVAVALITIYDMAKAMDKTMTITDIRLLEKSGGRSGQFHSE
jgi:cyclic pyranopterin monophosphate synthase